MLGDPSWAVGEGHVADLEGMVVEVASRLAAAAMAAGDAAGVEEAARAGLVASPWHDGLYQLRIEAARQRGDPARARALKAEQDAKLEDDIAPYDHLRPAVS